MGMNSATNGNQLHIGIFGKRNSGKSTLINALTGQNMVSVSDVAGTTTDPVYKAIEINGIGPCVLIDTAGFDDSSYLEKMKEEKTRKAMEMTDIALIVCSDDDIRQELHWLNDFKVRNIPVIMIINKVDLFRNTDKIRNRIYEVSKEEPIKISAISRLGIEMIRDEIIRKIPECFDAKDMTGELVTEGDTVLLVLPDRISAPKGRLLQPQIKVLRELLDKGCIAVTCTADRLEKALSGMEKPPKLIMADAEVLTLVEDRKPAESMIAAFPVIYTGSKIDVDEYRKQ